MGKFGSCRPPYFLGQIKAKVKVKVDPNPYSQNFGWTPTLGNIFGFKVQVGTPTLTTEYVHTYEYIVSRGSLERKGIRYLQ